MIRFSVLLFDFEGTLVDFQWNLKDAARDIKNELRNRGFQTSTWEDNYATLRNNAVQLASQNGLDKAMVLNRLDPIYDRYDQDAASRWSLRPEVKRVLTYLKDCQIKLGLVSNIGHRALDAVLLRLGLANLFDVIITRNDVEMLKPSGEGIRMALGRLGAEHSDVLYVGDSVTDILGARDAGVKMAIIQGGESAPTSLLAAGPTYLWKSMREIETLYNGGEQNE